MGLAVPAVPLLPVPDDLEAADDLADREEANDLCRDDAGAPVLCARGAAHLAEDRVGVERVGERRGVAERVERRLQVALDGLDGAAGGVSWRVFWVGEVEAWAYGGAMLRCCTMSLPSSRPTRP